MPSHIEDPFEALKEKAVAALQDQAVNVLLKHIDSMKTLSTLPYQAHVIGALLSNVSLLQSRGNQLFAARESAIEAVAWLEKAEEPGDLAQARINAGSAEREIGNLVASLEWFKRALEYYQEEKDNEGMGQAYMEMGISLKDQASITEARIYLDRAMEYLPMDAKRQRASTITALGLIRELLHNPEEASCHYNEARLLYQEIEDPENEAIVLLNLGVLANKAERYEEAKNYCTDSLEMARSVGAELIQIDCLSELGSIALSMNDLDTAREAYKQALGMATEGGYGRGQVFALIDLAVLARDYDSGDRALQFLDQALTVSLGMGAPDTIAEVLIHRGDVYAHHESWSGAIAEYSKAAEMLDAIRATIYREQEAIDYFRGERLDLFDRLVGIHAVQLEDAEAAFDWAEAAKAREFLRRIRFSPRVLPSILPVELYKEEEQLIQGLKQADLQLAFTDSAQATERAQSLERIEELQARLHLVWDSMREYAPEYVALREGKTATASGLIGTMRASHGTHSERVVLISFYLTKEFVFAFGFWEGLDAPKMMQVGINKASLERFVRSNFGEHDVVRFLIEDAKELWHQYDALLKPVAEWTNPGDVIGFAPHGILHYLPFHALRCEGHYLIERNPVFVVPSASAYPYSLLKRNSLQGPGQALVVGDSQSNLPFARHEAITLADTFHVEPLLESQVTREAIEGRLSGASLVHIAGHARFSAEVPFESGLYLSDGSVLTLQDILQLGGIQPGHVTLSGCETGVNDQQPGDELVGLTRSFLYAGTHTMLVSLWRVGDASTASLMERFYAYAYGEYRIPKATALQRAMLEVRDQPGWSSFFHWGSFSLIGDWV